MGIYLSDPRPYIFRGWHVIYNRDNPITGRWYAVKYGVSICAGTEEALQEMIRMRGN